MSVEFQELMKWKEMPDWNEKLVKWASSLSIQEIQGYLYIINDVIKISKRAPDELFIIAATLRGYAIMNMSTALQKQKHNIKLKT